MADIELVPRRIRAGVYEAILVARTGAPPKVEVFHLERSLPGVTVTPVAERPDHWELRVPIPAELLSQGVQTFLVHDGEGQKLGAFTIVVGEPLEDDIRAELDLLRAELDMLKRAFRRHCLETAQTASR
ncbi:MAG: hypothetical protein D6688_06575 [Alphaproteobacteria bacterium]|nr:MAG: hypothetical protein D6688_06575 [Alphaproteobacteria bacterium]